MDARGQFGRRWLVVGLAVLCASLLACNGEGPIEPPVGDEPPGADPPVGDPPGDDPPDGDPPGDDPPAPLVRYVDGMDGDDRGGSNACLDADAPCRTISHAVQASVDGDTIAIADATYTEPMTIDRSLTLRGESEAGTIIQAHEQPLQASARVVTIAGEVEVDIARVTIRHGDAPDGDESSDAWGGGIYADGGNLTLSDATVTANDAQHGGGIYVDGGRLSMARVTVSANTALVGAGMYRTGTTLALERVTFSRNKAANNGGGMFSTGDSPSVLTYVTFEGNEAGFGGGMFIRNASPQLEGLTFKENTADLRGGGLHNDGGTPAFLGGEFSGNRAGQSGGGMSNFEGSPVLVLVTFEGNEALGPSRSDGGGGLFSEGSGSSLTLIGVGFSVNKATAGGGGARIRGGAATLVHTFFDENRADDWGGGMFVEESAPSLTNVVFYENTSNRGGGMYNWRNADPVLTNVTFSDNSAVVDGGGLRNTENSSVTLVNSIVWGNTAGSGDEIAVGSEATTTLRYSVFADQAGDILVEGRGELTAVESVNEDPRFVDPSQGDFRLDAGSPAIDAGDPDTDLGLFDLLGEGPADLGFGPRLVGARIDAGPYEHDGAQMSVAGTSITPFGSRDLARRTLRAMGSALPLAGAAPRYPNFRR